MRDKVLIVDDVELNREILSLALDKEYGIFEAGDGATAIKIIDEHKDEIAAILLDLIMPKISGFEVLEHLNKIEIAKVIPTLVVSGENTLDVEKRCFEFGVADFIMKPFDATRVRNRVKNAIELFSYKNELEDKVHEQTKQLMQYNENIIEIIGTVVESRDMESGDHINRVKGFTKILAERMMEEYPEYGLTSEKVHLIGSASALHDIGKVAIPDSILLKPGRLTAEEFEIMKSHTTKGSDMLAEIRGAWDDEYGKASYEICRHHHERFDGKGYPDGLAGDDIPISAQLVSIADVYDALINKRVYKGAYPKDEACRMIVRGECGTFSPKLLRCFEMSRKEMEALAKKYAEIE